MKEASSQILYLSFPLLWAGNLGGWAMTSKLAGPTAGSDFLTMGAVGTSVLFIIQAVLYFSSKKTLVGQLLFISVGGLSLVWYVLSLVIPIFWMTTIGEVIKIAMVIFLCAMFGSNFLVGLYKFNESWNDVKPNVNDYFDSRSSALDWEGLIKSLRLSLSIFVPGLPAWIEFLLPLPLVLFVLLGLNFRKDYPTFSVFAWGIPCIVVASTLVQMFAMGIAQARKVGELETILNAKIGPNTYQRARRRRKRR